MSEEVWREIASKLRYCHGTSSKFANSIKKYGILPRKTDAKVRPSVYSGELESKKLNAVYVSSYYNTGTHFCGIAAKRASETVGGEPTIVDIKLDKEDLKRFESDEDSWSDDHFQSLFKTQCKFALEEGMDVACVDKPVKEAIEQAIKEGKLTKEQACSPPPWFSEIGCYGKFALRDGVHPSKITDIKKLK